MSEMGTHIEILFFAGLKERWGEGLRLSWEKGMTVENVVERLKENFPELEPFLTHTMIAVNEKYATRETPLNAGDRVALIPPVSGG